MKINWLVPSDRNYRILTDALTPGRCVHEEPYDHFHVERAVLDAVRNCRINGDTLRELKDKDKVLRKLGLTFHQATIDSVTKISPIEESPNWTSIPLGISSVRLRLGNQKTYRYGYIEEDLGPVKIARVFVGHQAWVKKHLGDYYNKLKVTIHQDGDDYRIGEMVAEKHSSRTDKVKRLVIDPETHTPTLELTFTTVVAVIRSKYPKPILNARLPPPDNLDDYDPIPPADTPTDSDPQPKGTRENPDAPWVLRLNPYLKWVGWQYWWEYEYVGSTLTKSKLHLLRNHKEK